MADRKYTTMSARFNEREMEFLRLAAERRKWSLAQLICAGACEKALHILNATGDAISGATEIVSRVVRQLQSPSYECYDTNNPDWDPITDQRRPIADPESGFGIEIVPDALPDGDFHKFLLVVRALGPELAGLLQEEYRRRAATTGKTLDERLSALLLPAHEVAGAPDSSASPPVGTTPEANRIEALPEAKKPRKAARRKVQGSQDQRKGKVTDATQP